MNVKSSSVKVEFGKLLQMGRKKAGMSKIAFANTIGVSHRTIDNWEDGKTFIENLGLIDVIHDKTGIYIPTLLDDAIKSLRSRRR